MLKEHLQLKKMITNVIGKQKLKGRHVNGLPWIQSHSRKKDYLNRKRAQDYQIYLNSRRDTQIKSTPQAHSYLKVLKKYGFPSIMAVVLTSQLLDGTQMHAVSSGNLIYILLDQDVTDAFILPQQKKRKSLREMVIIIASTG
mmetsp:Transcript_5041/g.7216  ORF Transcript_5041/g.7216 Transcript_5041/m.7216 type:complete len:142 (+) Transcript_5041:1131-1556(+)